MSNVLDGVFNEDELNHLFSSREVIKKNMGELGDRMSLNAYDIYQMLKNKFKQTQDQEDRKLALSYLRKACNYSMKQ
eukprot:CAMPEP_0170563712 /NCGR_PEP_ID=MMETSP0211-20121228/68493_1 /TAXON_ID=311385 /ORGANISM="Pseudokeronopsis sp., Strain OXSARD2" /LENGTH=76 /DNA_ID=CAMNT_0010882299 /DNA_START=205 /DNA_END=435 /DNA_ORIENTATION=+